MLERMWRNGNLLALLVGMQTGADTLEGRTSARVVMLLLVSSSPASGSVLTSRSLEPASDSVSPSVSAPPLLTLCLSLSQK